MRVVTGSKRPFAIYGACQSLGAGLLLAAAGGTACSEVMNISSSADTTLNENYPSNNLGGVNFFIAGTTQNYTRNRGLIRFNVAGVLPPGSRVRAVRLALEVTGQPNEPPNFAEFGLFRVLRPWGEGSQVSPINCASCRSQGAPAAKGEACWHSPQVGTTNDWGAPGAGSTNDVAELASGVTTIYGVAESPFEFASSSLLVADVQDWLDNPASNYGWALVCLSEHVNFTARRFGSREDPMNAPQLMIEFVRPPRLENARITGTQFQFDFTAVPGQGYSVETATSMGRWEPLSSYGPFSVEQRFTVSDSLVQSLRLYRIVSWPSP